MRQTTPERKQKTRRIRDAPGFPKGDHRLGGGVPLFQQTILGGGEDRLQSEGMREEVHRFDGFEDTRLLLSE